MTPARTGRGGGVLIGALVVDSIGNGLFQPLSLVFFTTVTDVALALIGVLLSVANLATLPLPVWTGALADRIGALPLVVAAQLLQAVGFLSYGWVRGPVGILVAATLVAVGVRIFWSAIFTTVADYVDASGSRRSKDVWYAWANMSRTAGLGIGGLITGFLIAGGGADQFRWAVRGSAVCFALAGLTIALAVRAPHARPVAAAGPVGYRALLRDRPFLGLIGVNTVFALSSMMFPFALPTVVLTGLRGPVWLSTGALVGNTILVSVLATIVVGRLRGIRRTRVVIAAAGLWAAGSVLLAALRPDALGWSVPLLIGATLLFTAGELLHAPVSTALATAAAPIGARGRYLASFQYSFTVAGIVAPAFFANLFEVGPPLPWLALALADLVAAAATLALERRLPAAAVRDRTGGEPVPS
jgi:MFS family permease